MSCVSAWKVWEKDEKDEKDESNGGEGEKERTHWEEGGIWRLVQSLEMGCVGEYLCHVCLSRMLSFRVSISYKYKLTPRRTVNIPLCISIPTALLCARLALSFLGRGISGACRKHGLIIALGCDGASGERRIFGSGKKFMKKSLDKKVVDEALV